MDEIKFRTLEELYRKVYPALNTKVAELKRLNILNIKEIDIWNYLKNNIWKNQKDLTLGEMVNDILTIPADKLLYKNPKKEENL